MIVNGIYCPIFLEAFSCAQVEEFIDWYSKQKDRAEVTASISAFLIHPSESLTDILDLSNGD